MWSPCYWFLWYSRRKYIILNTSSRRTLMTSHSRVPLFWSSLLCVCVSTWVQTWRSSMGALFMMTTVCRISPSFLMPRSSSSRGRRCRCSSSGRRRSACSAPWSVRTAPSLYSHTGKDYDWAFAYPSSVCLSVYSVFLLSVCLPICLSVYLSIHPSIYLSVCLSVIHPCI